MTINDRIQLNILLPEIFIISTQ